MPLIGVGLAVTLAIGAVVLLTLDDDAPLRTLAPGDEAPGDGDVAGPVTPAFRFTKESRALVRTSPERLGRADRRATRRAGDAALEALTLLYAEAFLDPDNRATGRYDDAFRSFAPGARRSAEARPAPLTAGPRAAERFEEIVPRFSSVVTRILLDRSGRPVLLVSAVRFSALATGPEPTTLRSTGQFFFERVHGAWRIVSYRVTRDDRPGEAA